MRVKTSNEVFEEVKKNGNKQIISFLPCDMHDCDCYGLIRDWLDKLSKLDTHQRELLKNKIGIIDCPRSKNKKRYEVRCANCGDLVAYVHADDNNLTRWCNLHYVSEAQLVKQKKVEYGEWHGCMGIQVSPIDGKIGVECACGNDTRDFRVKNNLTGEQLETKIKLNMKGRELNQKDSKFIIKEIK
jgi:hypothetical protein